MVFLGGRVKLQSHEATHTGKKDHVCHTCGASFIRPDSLRHHIQRIHEHSGKYACVYCDYKTIQQESLDIHVNAVHTKAGIYISLNFLFFCL